MSFQSEYHEQKSVANYLKAMHSNVLFTTSPEGMRLPIGSAIKLKNMGYRRGTPDMLILEPRGMFHGLFVEMKRIELRDASGKIFQTKGVLSPHQKEMIKLLKERNYMVVVCYGSSEAIDEIEAYLKIPK